MTDLDDGRRVDGDSDPRPLEIAVPADVPAGPEVALGVRGGRVGTGLDRKHPQRRPLVRDQQLAQQRGEPRRVDEVQQHRIRRVLSRGPGARDLGGEIGEENIRRDIHEVRIGLADALRRALPGLLLLGVAARGAPLALHVQRPLRPHRPLRPPPRRLQ